MNEVVIFARRSTCRTSALAISLLVGLSAISVAWPLWAACAVTSESVSFGSYAPIDTAPTDGVGTIAVSCDASTTYTLSLSAGSGQQDARTLADAGATLSYNLYTDAAHSTIWGDATGATSTVSGTGTTATYSVYGRIVARQNVTVGTYTDSIVVTLDY